MNYFLKNPQTTFAPTFLAHIIVRIDGVIQKSSPFTKYKKLALKTPKKFRYLTYTIHDMQSLMKPKNIPVGAFSGNS